MASFSGQVKSEICGNIRKAAAHRAFLTGVLLAAKRFSDTEIVLQTECEAFAGLFPQMMQTAAPMLRYDTEFRRRSGKQAVWCFTLRGQEEISFLTEALCIRLQNRAEALRELSGSALAQAAAGAFVICGSITDPERRYHLELVLPDAELSAAAQQILSEPPQEIRFKSTVRKGDTVLYLKQNEQICDALTYFGAPNASMALAEQQIYKSIRSQTNRRLNCDLANIDKTVAAGAQQVAAIRLISETAGISALPENLQEIASLRLSEPEASLRELGAMCNPPLTRSGVNHRLRRIAEIAEKLNKE
ncbi:MAG: DNA-binding protein WhiA [Oscillospiraceae bacterium]|nr:DNA-binding protein WhiA [Oscillospiraceae bacterium]